MHVEPVSDRAVIKQVTNQAGASNVCRPSGTSLECAHSAYLRPGLRSLGDEMCFLGPAFTPKTAGSGAVCNVFDVKAVVN